MNRLKDKNIYYFITGAKKADLSIKIIKEMIGEGASVYTIPTKASLDFINLSDLRKIKGNIIKCDWSDKIKLPKEDAVLIAPCTFNTLNAISAGIADSYPLCLVASSIGKNIPIFIAPAMNKMLWDHPIMQHNIKKLEKWNCRVIWPEISANKATMMSIGKILDALYFNFKRINYLEDRIKDFKLENKLRIYREKYFLIFNNLGKFLASKNLNLPTAGCISIRVKEGFLVTSSGSDLSNLHKDNISLVIGFNEHKNLIQWIGAKTPSSETPLHCIIQKHKKDKIVLHFHCPKMTYSNNLAQFNTRKYIRYGTFDLGYQLLKILDKNNFCIMKYHGEVVLGDTISKIKGILNKFDKLS